MVVGVQSRVMLIRSYLVRSLCANGNDADCTRCYIPKWILLSISRDVCEYFVRCAWRCCRCRCWKSEKRSQATQHSIVFIYRAYTRCCASIHRECKVVMRKKQRIFRHQCVEQFLFSRISSVLQFWRFSGIWFFTFSTIPSKRSNAIRNICVRAKYSCVAVGKTVHHTASLRLCNIQF